MEDYFKALQEGIAEQSQGNKVDEVKSAYLTVKVDIDCKIYCDGDFLDLFEANKTKKVSIPRGQHIIDIESEHAEGLTRSETIDAAQSDKNYLLLINDMKLQEHEFLRHRAIENEANERAAEQARKEAEKEQAKIAAEQERKAAIEKARIEAEELKLSNAYIGLVRANRIVSISHAALVDLFRTALYGSDYLEADYDKDFYKSIPDDKKIGDGLEDKMADCLLNGGEIYITDRYANKEVYSDLGKLMVKEGDEYVVIYTIHLKDVVAGLEACANHGEFESHCFHNLLTNNDDGNLDQMEADELLQYIVFGESIYG